MPAHDAQESFFANRDDALTQNREGPQGYGAATPHTSPTLHRAADAKQPHAVDFVDDAGVRWRVHERDTRHDTGARGDHCLLFTSAQAVRRVWDYPRFWYELSPEALSKLSWRT